MKILLFFLTFLVISPLVQADNLKPPKLIVLIVVDQLRGDLIHRYQSQFNKDGFNYLLSHSLNFYNAHHPHANTTTCAGHATIATGSYPAFHGIIDNDWYDRTTNKYIYCMEDLSVHQVATPHTKHPLAGHSARNLQASTISDEIILSKRGKAYAVSFKDRAAIALAGHAGKAFWFDKTNGGFVTSSYYYSAYPQWVNQWNKKYQPQNFTWELSQEKSKYYNAQTPIAAQQSNGFGQSFPHQVAHAPSEPYFYLLSKTPKADQLTADFTEQLLIEEHLGTRRDQTDYLGISFSATDVIGHQFGPNSLESEDNLLQLDKTLAHLLKTIDKQVGLEHSLIILTGDHGIGDGPAYLKKHHIKEAAPLNVKTASKHVISFLSQRYSLPKETLMALSPPYVYLNHQIIKEHKLNLISVSQNLAEFLNHEPGVFKAYTLPVTNNEKTWLSAKVERMAYPNRAGDIYIVTPLFQSKGDHGEGSLAHGSPWQYDSYVPLLFVNPNFKSQQISRPVYTTDIAMTLSTLLMIKPPSAALGTPLEEVLRQYGF